MLRISIPFLVFFGLCILITSDLTPAARAAAPAAELLEREGIEDAAQRAWIARDYSLLDSCAEVWRAKSTRTSSGYWALSIFYNHLDNRLLAQNCALFPAGYDWVAVDDWMTREPSSPTPVILKALMLVRQAQGCYVPPRTSRVTRPAPQSFNVDFLRAARDLLEERMPYAAQDPHWYTAYLRVLRLQGASDEQLLLAHADALAKHPLYYQTHFELFSYLILRWYPNLQMIDGFANTVLAGTKNREGF